MKSAKPSQSIEGSLSRRQVLQAGGGLAATWMIPAWLQAQSSTAKSLIQIYLAGGPSHLDTFDMKPSAPVEYRGEFRPIATNVSGIQICELLPRLARMADRYSIIRSVTGLPSAHGSNPYEFAWPKDDGGQASASLRTVAASQRSLDAYGAHEWEENQKFINAARLVEAGVRHVSFEYGFWDTHGNNFGQLRRQLPPLDRGLSALIQDLDRRGLGDDVLIIMSGEFGRTPKINNGAGRDHWPHASFVFLAGGGLRHGQVIGATDRRGEFVTDRPVGMDDVLTTVRAALHAEQPAREQLTGTAGGLVPGSGRMIRELL